MPTAIFSRHAALRTSRLANSTLSFLAFVCGSSIVTAQETRQWSIAPAPEWIERVEAPLSSRATLDVASTGLEMLAIDLQVRLVDGRTERFSRQVSRVTSPAGVQDAGQWTVAFSPAHERLRLHELTLHRGDQSIACLREDAVQILQREEELEAASYHGELTAFVLIPDLRVGDAIESAYTIEGSNPVLANHVHEDVALQDDSPVRVISYRVVTDRPLNVRRFGGAPEPVVHDAGSGVNEYLWRVHDVPAARSPDDLPEDYDVVPWVELSDLTRWDQVVAWGLELFEPPDGAPRAIVDLADSIRASEPTAEGRTLAVIHEVQDDVRYFALAIAESTHRPAAPEVVLERRFGDCKDKSLLAVALLRELGIDAHVALVQSSGGENLPRLTPAVGVFDHAIVAADVEGSRVWLDPTAMGRRGRLADVASRDFSHALVIAPGVDSLTAIARPPIRSPERTTRARYRIAEWGGKVELEVEHAFSGESAQDVRTLRDTSAPADFEETFTDWVRAVHDDALAVGGPRVVERERSNEIEVTQRFELSDTWDHGADDRLELAIQPVGFADALVWPEPDRTAPLGLDTDVSIRQETTIELPEDLRGSEGSFSVDDGPLRFQFTERHAPRRVTLSYLFSAVERRVEPTDLGKYRDTLESIDQRLAYKLWIKPGAATSGAAKPERAVNWTVLALGSLWALVLTFVCVQIARREPYLALANVEWNPSLVGRGGWLALLGLAVLASPFRVAMTAWETLPAYEVGTWHALTTPGGASYDSRWAPILLMELLSNLALLWGTLLCAWAYFRRSRSFPLVFVVVMVANAAARVADAYLASAMPTQEASSSRSMGPRELGGLLGIALWIAYVLRSRRVRSTFLPPPPSEPDLTNAQHALDAVVLAALEGTETRRSET